MVEDSKEKTNTDENILQRKADILRRLENISKNKDKPEKKHTPVSLPIESLEKDISSEIKNVVPLISPGSKKSERLDYVAAILGEKAAQPTTAAKIDIPTFNLAEQIISEHRKSTMQKRTKAQPLHSTQLVKAQQNTPVPQSQSKIPPLSKYNQLIAEIVARDIKALLKANI